MYQVHADTSALRQGLRDFDRRAPYAISRAHRNVAQIVAVRGRIEAPERTGRLKRDIRPGGTQTGAKIRSGSSRVPYAGPIHWGWPGHNIEPNEYLLRAADHSASQVESEYNRAMDRALRRAGL